MSSLKTRRYRRNVSKKRNNKKSKTLKRKKIKSRRSYGGAPNNTRNNMSIGEKIEINEEIRDAGTGVSKNYNWEKFIPSGSSYCKGKDTQTDDMFGGPNGRCVSGVIRSQDQNCGQHSNEWSCLKDSCTSPDFGKGKVSCCSWRKSAHFAQDEDVNGPAPTPWTEVHDYIWHDPDLVSTFQDSQDDNTDEKDTQKALRNVYQRDGYRMDRFVDDGTKIEGEGPTRTFWKKCKNIGRYDWEKDPNGHKCWTSKELDGKLTDTFQNRFFDHKSYTSKNKKKKIKGKNSATNKRFNVVDVVPIN
jgi:hypothetical protein